MTTPSTKPEPIDLAALRADLDTLLTELAQLREMVRGIDKWSRRPARTDSLGYVGEESAKDEVRRLLKGREG